MTGLLLSLRAKRSNLAGGGHECQYSDRRRRARCRPAVPPALSPRGAPGYLRHPFRRLGRGGVGSADQRDRAHRGRHPLGHQHAGYGRADAAGRDQAALPRSAGDDGDRLWRRRAKTPRRRTRRCRVHHQAGRFRPAEGPAAPAACRCRLMSPSKILGVDDEADFEALIRQRFRRQVRDSEFTFRFAHNGEEALAALKAEPDIQLMLLDINMPVMDGLTLLSELRERKSSVRAIIVSAYGDMTNLRTAMNRGAFDFVTKPVDLSDLEITVRKALANIAKLREMDRLRRAAERARNNLARYFSPNIVELLAAQDEPLGAVRRETIAVLFADIVGFTQMAETMPPEAVMAMLREFHARMTAQIFACGGTVDKYIGDAIVAVFGVPSASSKDAANALACAGKMLDALESWNDDRERAAEGRLAMGIGRSE